MDERLTRHLQHWLGAWPPAGGAADGDDGRRTHGARLGRGGAPDRRGRARPRVRCCRCRRRRSTPWRRWPTTSTRCGPRSASGALAAALGWPGARLFDGVFRWSEAVADLPDAGEWVPVDDDRVPPWLLPFGGEVLMAFDDDGAYVAGVGIKRHDPFGHELAVVTEERGRGQGLARRLVAQAGTPRPRGRCRADVPPRRQQRQVGEGGRRGRLP